MTRWVCPNCGSGKNAPERPRKNDVRRYCLRCSEQTGVLVERQAPALERRRAAARTAQFERAQRKRTEEKDRYVVVCLDALGRDHRLDLWAETRRALLDMGSREHLEQLTVRLRSDGHHTGRAFPWDNRILYSLPSVPCYERTLELIYHEAAHIAAGSQLSGSRRRWHGPKFQRTLADALQRRWPFLVYGSTRGGAYARDEAIVDQLVRRVEAGGTLA